jgi:hypothetical protein
MDSKQILASGFTVKRFVIQSALIFLLSGIVFASMAIFDLDLRLLFAVCFLVATAVLSTISIILSRFTQFWALAVSNILVGLIPFIFLKSYCYFQITSNACSTHSINGYSFAFWVFPAIMLWIPWAFTPLGKTRRKYG